MLKKEIKCSERMGVIERANDYEWGEPYFEQPKKTNIVQFISNFRNLNWKVKHELYAMTKVQEMLLKLEGFKYDMSLKLNIEYYHIRLSTNASNLFTSILP